MTDTDCAGIATVFYFDSDQPTGQREVYCCGAAESGTSFSAYWPNIAYFCPMCGQFWGRAIYDFHFAYAPKVRTTWSVESRRCVPCGDGQFLVGQSLSGCDEELVRRELMALLERY